LNISVQAANLSDGRIESIRKNLFGSENRIESNRIETFFCPNGNALLDAGVLIRPGAIGDEFWQLLKNERKPEWIEYSDQHALLHRVNIYTVFRKTSTFVFFEHLCQKLTDFNDFWYVKSLEYLTLTS